MCECSCCEYKASKEVKREKGVGGGCRVVVVGMVGGEDGEERPFCVNKSYCEEKSQLQQRFKGEEWSKGGCKVER